MRTLAAACAACAIGGCAIAPRNDLAAAAPVRTKPPSHAQASVSDYFDLMMPATTQRRLSFGTLEASDCALHGTGGRHQGWMLPVIYDTTATASAGKAMAAGRTSGSGTSAAQGKAPAAAPKEDASTASLQDVKISGKGYYFWFSSDTIAAVTRRADACPP